MLARMFYLQVCINMFIIIVAIVTLTPTDVKNACFVCVLFCLKHVFKDFIF